MRIGIDGSCWRNNRGFGRFTRDLCRELFRIDADHSYDLLSDGPVPEDLGPRVNVHFPDTRRSVVEAATADGRRALGDIMAFRRVASGLRLDALFYPAVYSWFPPPARVPNLVTFHDAIAERYPDLVFPKRIPRLAWKAKVFLARRFASRILTVSNTARAEVETYLGIPSEQIDVICEGASEVFAKVNDPAAEATLLGRFGMTAAHRHFVYVGGFAPHKNLERLLDAFAKFCDLRYRLVMVGDPEGGGFLSNYRALRARCEQDDLRGRVHFTGYVSDEDLAVIYSSAIALVMPSLSEGFGLPALEAMRCGCPVLAARGGAVMEVAGTAGLAFDPCDESEIAAKLHMVATDSSCREELARATRMEADRNTWARGARLTLDAIERLRR